jgi:hypothetical protein
VPGDGLDTKPIQMGAFRIAISEVVSIDDSIIFKEVDVDTAHIAIEDIGIGFHFRSTIDGDTSFKVAI